MLFPLETILVVHGVRWSQIGEALLLLEIFLKGLTVIEKGTVEVNVLAIFKMAHLSAIEKEVVEVHHHVTFLAMIGEVLVLENLLIFHRVIEREIDEDLLPPSEKAIAEAPHLGMTTAVGTRATLLTEKMIEEDTSAIFMIAVHHHKIVGELIFVEKKTSMVQGILIEEVLHQVIVAGVLTTGHLLAEKNVETEGVENDPLVSFLLC